MIPTAANIDMKPGVIGLTTHGRRAEWACLYVPNLINGPDRKGPAIAVCPHWMVFDRARYRLLPATAAND